MSETAEVSNDASNDLEDLQCLEFPGDVDWSSTLVLRCDPKGGPYSLSDVVHALHDVVRRNEVFNLGPTFLNHVFTISFKSQFALDGFTKFVQKNPKSPKPLKVKGHKCTLTRVPTKCVALNIRNIPLEVDSSHIIQVLKKYGTIVKTEWIKNNFRGWFHVYTNERKFTLQLNHDVTLEDLPYTVQVKGLYGSVFVEERNPKCLECYYSGHRGDVCSLKGCLLYNDTIEKFQPN